MSTEYHTDVNSEVHVGDIAKKLMNELAKTDMGEEILASVLVSMTNNMYKTLDMRKQNM